MNFDIVPERRHSALLIIDVQRDFTLKDPTAEIPGTQQVVPFIKNLVKEYRRLVYPVIHVVRLYNANGSNVDLCRRQAIESGKQIVISGSDGAELIDDLKPSSKIRLDSNLLLSGKLQKIGSMEWLVLHSLNVNTAVICGCNFPNCPRTTIYEASERDLRIVMVMDATSLVYDTGLQELKSISVSLMKSNDCISWLADVQKDTGKKCPLQHRAMKQV